MLARRQGKLRKGGLPDTDKAAKSVLLDWTGWVKPTSLCTDHRKSISIFSIVLTSHFLLPRGRISYFTHPPETHTLPTHVSAEIVTEMGKAFDWDELEKGNQEVLAGNNNTFTHFFLNSSFISPPRKFLGLLLKN